MKDFSESWKQWKRRRHTVAGGGSRIEKGVRYGRLKQLRNRGYAVAGADIEPGVKCSLHR